MLILHGPARWRLEHVYTVHHSTSSSPSHTLPLFLLVHLCCCYDRVRRVLVLLSPRRYHAPRRPLAVLSRAVALLRAHLISCIVGDTSSNTALWLFSMCPARVCTWSAVVARLMCVFWGVECVGMVSRLCSRRHPLCLAIHRRRASRPTLHDMHAYARGRGQRRTPPACVRRRVDASVILELSFNPKVTPLAICVEAPRRT